MKHKSNKTYFGKKEEIAIKKYINEETLQEEKKELYNNIIFSAFLKLSENIINTYGTKHRFFELGYTFNELINISLSILHSKIYLFNPNRIGKKGLPVKAFSFFGTVLKRDLINLSIRNQKDNIRHISIDNEDTYIDYNAKTLYYKDQDNIDNKFFISMLAKWFNKYAEKIGITTNIERNILDAILYQLTNIDSLELFNKKAIYITIKEITGVESAKITPVLNKLKVTYPAIRNIYLEEGRIGSGSYFI